MSRTLQSLLLPLALVAICQAGHAAGIGVRAGSDGVGADVAFQDLVPFVPGASLRFGISDLDINHSVNNTNVHYDGKLKLEDGSVLLDWAPLGPMFRISGGVMFGTNKLTLNAKPTNGTYNLGNGSYQASQVGSVSGEVKPSSNASPYVGIGFGRVANMGVNLYGDLGVLLNGGMKGTVNATCGASMSANTCVQFQNDAGVESQKLANSVHTLKAWPVARIGVTIGF